MTREPYDCFGGPYWPPIRRYSASMQSSWRVVVMACAMLAAAGVHGAINATELMELTGWNGTWVDHGKTFKMTTPRNEALNISVQGIFVPGADSNAAFRESSSLPGQVVFMNEYILLDDEVNPLIKIALDQGLNVSALHNHFLFDKPKAYYMHLHAVGPASKIAVALRLMTDTANAIRANRTDPAAPTFTGPRPDTRSNSLTLAPIRDILSTANSNATKDAKTGTVMMISPSLNCTLHGEMMDHSLGCQSWATFAGSDENAILFGDLAIHEHDTRRALVSVLKNNLLLTSIVNHFVEEHPRIIFAHYWGQGKAAELAQSLANVITESIKTPT